MRISAYTIVTNAIKNQFPFIESIKSYLPVVDEMIVVDGGSIDGTVEAIREIGDSRIRIVTIPWDQNWTYKQMGINWNVGLYECTGDVVITFDADYILHENVYGDFNPKWDLRLDCETMLQETWRSAQFTRFNFILSDRFFLKSKKTLAVNMKLCREGGLNIKHGFDPEIKNWGFEPVVAEFEENGVWFGKLLRRYSRSMISSANVYNYDYMFMTEDVAKAARHRHYLAEVKQFNFDYHKAIMPKHHYKVSEVSGKPEIAWKEYRDQCLVNMGREQGHIRLQDHPLVIQERIKNLTPLHQGYDSWGWLGEKSEYYA